MESLGRTLFYATMEDQRAIKQLRNLLILLVATAQLPLHCLDPDHQPFDEKTLFLGTFFQSLDLLLGQVEFNVHLFMILMMVVDTLFQCLEVLVNVGNSSPHPLINDLDLELNICNVQLYLIPCESCKY